jgi:HD-like signal output (HDOD) protein/FixJ family two-component response regulator
VTDRPHILFVDDEPSILGGLRRMLRTHRDRWEMSFVDGGAEALASMRDNPCDVIVSDYRMPGMDGAQLLEHVRSEHPGTARVILSGQTNEENLLGIMVLAHESLTKPTTPEQLVATVERLISVRPPAVGEGPRHGTAIIESLPSAPHTLIDLLAALAAGDASPQSVGAVIERDPAATAKLLHLANTSAYTADRNVSDVSQAVALLGLHTVRGLVTMHDLIRPFDVAGEVPGEWIDTLTRHAVETSRLARLLAAGTAWESQACTAGLLHEVGQLVLASAQPAAFGKVLRDRSGPDGGSVVGDGSLCAAEQAAFGITHVVVGTDLLRLWGLPAEVTEAVAGHTSTEIGPVTGPSSAVVLAHALVEADCGSVCGSRDRPGVDEDRLDSVVAEAVSRWRSQPGPLRR